MNLLQEAKKSNKQAYCGLLENYNHIFYKVAKLYFLTDREVYSVIKQALSESYKELANAKDEPAFLRLALKILISVCETEKKKNPEKDVESSIDQRIYKDYLANSSVELYLTNAKIAGNYKLIAILYYYANLSYQDISKILGIPSNTISNQVGEIRTALLNVINQAKEGY